MAVRKINNYYTIQCNIILICLWPVDIHNQKTVCEIVKCYWMSSIKQNI